MYIVTARTGTEATVLHDLDPDSLQKLASGSFSEEINVIPAMNFSLFPQNAGYDKLLPLTTIIEVYNTKTKVNDFEGRLLKKTGTMKRSGQIAQKWTCEGFMGYLMDSVQDYHVYENTDVPDFLQALLDAHNAMTEPSKHIYLGLCDIHDTSSKTTAYRRTLEEIRELLVNRLGGEIRVRKVSGKLYLDYVKQYGKNSSVKIELERNLQEIEVSTDATSIITRLIPLGCQLGDETAERLTIAEVNDGCIWIDDEEAMAEYGTCMCAVQEWDGITLPENLKARAIEFLKQNNVKKKHYKLTALDLSLIGLDVEGFTTGDSYLTTNRLMSINDWLRAIKRNVDICESVKSTMEVGDKTESLTVKANKTYNYVTYEAPKRENEVLAQAKDRASAMIKTATKGKFEFDAENGELLLMTSEDKYAETTRVWRFNTSGWGVSNNGYDGDYNMAATFDGGFVADFIMAGTLTGIEIRNGDDTFHVDKDGSVTASAITITGGRINITTDNESYDALNLNSGALHSNFTPLKTQFQNSDTKRETNFQAGGVWLFADYDNYEGRRTVITSDAFWMMSPTNEQILTISSDSGNLSTIGSVSAGGSISTDKNVNADGNITAGGSVTADSGWFKSLRYYSGDGYYDLASSLDVMRNNISTLWSAVFG